MWMNKEYNPPTRWLPYLKLAEAALWFLVIIIWWDEVNNRDEIFGIGIMIFIVIYGAKDVYDAVKLLIINKKKIIMIFWDIVIPALAGGILGPIYARWFRWWRRSRKQSKKQTD